MSGVEAAASLFGPEEPDSDPFAALGAEATQRSSDDLFDNHDAVPSNTENLKPIRDGAHSLTSEATAQDTLQFHAQHEPAPDYLPSSMYLGSGSTSQQEWHNQQGQLQSYGSSSNTSALETFTPPLQQYNTKDANYPSFSASNSYVPTLAQSPYNTYLPSQPGNNHLSTQSTASTASSYNSYAYTPPSRHEPSSLFNSPYTPSGQTAHTVPGQTAPSKPTVPALTSPLPTPTTTTVVRPKISNAYDPPFPTIAKVSRRTGRAASGKNSYGYNAYGTTPPTHAYNSPPQNTPDTSHPPPPPQRLPPSNPPPEHPRFSPQSSSGPLLSTRNSAQPTYGSHMNATQAVGGKSNGTPHENELYDVGPSAIHHEVSPSQQSLSKPSLSPNKIHELVSDNKEVTNPDLSYIATPSVDSHVPLDANIRAKSPREHALPPSPTSSQTGRLSPFTDINMKRTLSPQPVEHLRGKTSDSSQHAHRDGTVVARPHHHVHSSPLRSSSPSQTHDVAARGPHTGMGNPYVPKPVNGQESYVSLATTQTGDSYGPNAHANGYKGERTSSPSSFSTVTTAGYPTKGHPANPYAPAKIDTRNRSMSNGSIISTMPTGIEDPYVPNPSLKYVYPNGHDTAVHSSLAPEHHLQEVLLKPFQTPYAPSPSLLGSNDPLGRTARRPIFSFGFGGKLVTCFHGADLLNTGFDVALSARNSTGVHIRILKKLIPESALYPSTVSFPGPLYGDPTTSTTSLVRSGPTSQAKTKKANIIRYLSERTDELALGLRYLDPDSIENIRAEGKVVLVKLLQLMVEHDGRLTGTPELDTAVRLALVPRLEGTFGTNNFTTMADSQGSTNSGFSSDIHEPAVSVTMLRPSNLDKLQDFLLRGERRQAYHYALDEKLWAHAMLISSSIDKEAWKEVVNEFVRQELGASIDPSSATSGRESLRVAYSLYSGQGASAVQELVSQNLLTQTTGRLQPSALPHPTPKTPKFGTVAATSPSIPLDILSKWTNTAAMMLSNPLSQETSTALSALGDQLAANELHEAAHVCYLLAPQTSPIGGIGHPSARIILVGSRNPQAFPNFSKDQDPVIFSEVVEFALSLSPPTKGQDAFSGIPHLQAYRFIRAMSLVEIGDISQANKYCEAITGTLSRGSPYVTPALIEQLKGLSDRIAGVTHVDKSFWTGAKLSKPSLDSIGGWLEGRFTKLVTGDADMDKVPEEETSIRNEPDFAGPFSHYSTISSTTPSARSSPQPQVMNVNVLPPVRSGSAMASASSYAYPPPDRASSAMDHIRRKPSPAPRISSANASTSSFVIAPSFSQTFSQTLENQTDYSGYSASDDLVTPRPSLTGDDEGTVHHASWWNDTTYAEGATTQTPTAPAFMHVDENAISASSSSDGFISFADSASYAIGPQTSNRLSSQPSEPAQEDEEDLGFGNSKNKAEQSAADESSGEHTARPSFEQVPPSHPEDKPTVAQRGWFSRWWRKGDTPGPVRANLGESSTFYYDKEQKRWVNKKADSTEEAKPATPPPPSRAQTASPAMTGPRPPVSGSGPPPNRPASAIDLSTSPPSRTTMRVRSNLAPTPESAPSTPTGSRLALSGPHPGRPKSQASKRNIRSRYVDVLQQESST